MNNEKYNQIIGAAYKFFKNSFPMKKSNPPKNYINEKGQLLGQEEFINRIKTDDEFSKTWGLKIEERKLSLEERNKWSWDNWGITCEMESVLDEQEVPTKLITITYNNEKTEIYEN